MAKRVNAIGNIDKTARTASGWKRRPPVVSVPWETANEPLFTKQRNQMNHPLCPLGSQAVVASVALVGLLLGGTLAGANDNPPPPATSRLRLAVIKTLAQPVIARNTPGAEQIAGGFEAGTTVKVTIDGKPEYHLFSHAFQTLGWERPQADHWFSQDGLKWQPGGALLTPNTDQKTGLFCTYGHPTPFYVEKESQWHLSYSVFRNSKPGWTGGNTIVYSAKSKVHGAKGIYGPWDFPGEVVFVPGVSSPATNMVAVSISCPFQVKDGRWAIFFCPSRDGHPIPMSSATQPWPVALSFGPSPTGPFTCLDPCEPIPMIDPPDFTENVLPIKVRGPKSGRDYWVAVFDFLAPEVSAYTPKNVFGFCWSEDGVHWPKEHGQVVNVDDGLAPGERGWWRGSWSIRTPHQMIDEGGGTYTVFFTGGTHDSHFDDFRAVGMVKVKLVED